MWGIISKGKPRYNKKPTDVESEEKGGRMKLYFVCDFLREPEDNSLLLFALFVCFEGAIGLLDRLDY